MVYEPDEDSFLLRKHIARFARGSVLDMGTGSGILAHEASKYAKTVVAADIDPEAIKVAAKPAMDLEVIESDLFEKITGKFDLIMFNPPYLPEDKGIKDAALYGGKLGYEIILRFLEQAKHHLNPGGKILLVFSSFTGKKKVESAIRSNGFSFRQIDKSHIFFEDIYLYLLNIK